MKRATARNLDQVTGTNECGKLAFASRSAARRFLKNGGGRAKGWDHLRPYRCDDCGLIHNGHLPARVITGDITETEWYARMHITSA